MFRIAGLLKVTVGPKIDKGSTLVKEFCLGLSRLMEQGIAVPSNHFTLLRCIFCLMCNMYFCCKIKCISAVLKCYQHCCLPVMGKPRNSIFNKDFGKEANFEALGKKR